MKSSYCFGERWIRKWENVVHVKIYQWREFTAHNWLELLILSPFCSEVFVYIMYAIPGSKVPGEHARRFKSIMILHVVTQIFSQINIPKKKKQKKNYNTNKNQNEAENTKKKETTTTKKKALQEQQKKRRKNILHVAHEWCAY